MKKNQVTDVVTSEEKIQELPYNELLTLLLKSIKSLGINVDMIILDLILNLRDEVNKKGKNISLNDIEKISQEMVFKYQEQPKK